MTRGPEQRPAQPQRQAIDLGTYNPSVTFVEPLRHALRTERLAESSAHAQPVDPIQTLTTRLAKLPHAALAPAIDATIDAFTPDGDNQQSPSELAVHSYLDRITTDLSEKLTNDVERNLQRQYNESQRNYNYYTSFTRLQDLTTAEKKFTDDIDSHWDTLHHAEESQPEAPDEERIAGLWGKVRVTLDDERAYEQSAIRSAQHIAEKRNPGLFSDAQVLDKPDPRISGSQQLIEKSTAYNQLLDAHREQRDSRIGSLTEAVNELRSVPATVSARVLWEHVLTDEDRAVITQARNAYQTGRDLAEEAEGFSSYEDPAYRQFIDTHRGFHTAWDKQMRAGMDSFRTVRKILIDESRIPIQTSDALRDKDHPIMRHKDETVIDVEKSGLLTGYAADIVTVFLKTDFDAPKAA